MRRYSEAVKADVRRRTSPPQRQSVAQISEELGIHIVTLYNWRKAWRLQGEVVSASGKDPEGWRAADKCTVVLETAGLNPTELSAYCRELGLHPEQVERWRQAAWDANDKLSALILAAAAGARHHGAVPGQRCIATTRRPSLDQNRMRPRPVRGAGHTSRRAGTVGPRMSCTDRSPAAQAAAISAKHVREQNALCATKDAYQTSNKNHGE